VYNWKNKGVIYMFEVAARQPNLSDVRRAMRDTLQNNGTVYLGKSPEIIDVVVVPVEGLATLFRSEYPYYNDVSEYSELQVAGIMRRNNWLRKYVQPCEVEEVGLTDRMVLESADGTRFVTPRIAEIKP
jgi:hypothetical protein